MKAPAWTLLPLLLSCATPVETQRPLLKALIVDGQSNHADWALQTRTVRTYLRETGLFSVDVATAPPKGSNLAGFRPKFSNYQVVLSLYNGEPWPEETRKDFVDFLRRGGGFVPIHMADNAFPQWEEYNRMIGLGGWYGRNEKSGPYFYFKDDRPVRDPAPGLGGSHGIEHPFAVDTRDRDHPVTRGLPARWMHERDELYDRLRGPAENVTVLATAYSDPATGGSGRDEPVLMAIRYGDGRVFHTTLGHGWYSRECVGFIVTLQRGAEWAATGKVTQRVPRDFPSDTVRVRRFDERPNALLCLAFSPDGKSIASGGEEGTVRIWDRDGRFTAVHGSHDTPVTSVRFAPDGFRIASAGRLLETGLPISAFWPEGAAFSADGNRFAMAGEFVTLWDLRGGNRVFRAKCWARQVAFSPDGRTLAAACADGKIRLFGEGSPELLSGHDGPVDAVACRGDGKMLASGGRDGRIILWDLPARAQARVVEPRSGWINDVAFSPDGKLLAAAHRVVTLWEVAGGRKVAERAAPGGRANAVAFSPDGKTLAAAGAGPAPATWDVETIVGK